MTEIVYDCSEHKHKLTLCEDCYCVFCELCEHQWFEAEEEEEGECICGDDDEVIFDEDLPGNVSITSPFCALDMVMRPRFTYGTLPGSNRV